MDFGRGFVSWGLGRQVEGCGLLDLILTDVMFPSRVQGLGFMAQARKAAAAAAAAAAAGRGCCRKVAGDEISS